MSYRLRKARQEMWLVFLISFKGRSVFCSCYLGLDFVVDVIIIVIVIRNFVIFTEGADHRLMLRILIKITTKRKSKSTKMTRGFGRLFFKNASCDFKREIGNWLV